jgi:PRC-barrel domain
MLRNTKDLEGSAIGGTNGVIGEVSDLYFDDEEWVIRYLVLSTGMWLANRKVLISPVAFGRQQRWQQPLRVALTKEQVKNGPDIDTDRPISRRHEVQYLEYYGYPSYWKGAYLWGVSPTPNMMPIGAWDIGSADPKSQKGGLHLHSCNAVMRYHIHGSDGDIGQVHGLLVDEETWAIRYFIVNTSHWWPGHQALVAPQWISDVNWFSSNITVDLTRITLKNAPRYDAALPLDRPREIAMLEYYGRPGYWAREPRAGVHAARKW